MAINENKVVLYEKKGPIAYITLNRPEKINAMSGEVYAQLEAAIEDYTVDDDLRCAIMTGAGGNFSSGGDLRWTQENHSKAMAQGREFPLNVAETDAEGRILSYNHPTYIALAACPKPVIAALDGYCLASAFNCAVLFCDIRIASERAKLGMPVVKRGIGGTRTTAHFHEGYPDGMPHLWHMTLGNALYMMLTGEPFSSEQALHMGIVQEVVPHEKLMARATELATSISEADPGLVSFYKRKYYQMAELGAVPYHRLEQWTPLVGDGVSADKGEGVRAFLEKRKPNREK